jgi:putative ABC transport system permease protein
LVLILLGLAVAAAVGGAAAAYNLAPAEGNAVFGAATHSLEFDAPDRRGLAVDIPAAGEWFDTVDVIGRRYATVPGLFDPIELRSQDPLGPLSTPMLTLVEGSYPSADGEMALTDGTSETLETAIDATVELDGTEWKVVGVVENPSDLNDEFALIAPGAIDGLESATMLVGGGQGRAESFRPPSGASAVVAGRPENEGLVAAIGVLMAASVVLLLVSLVAAAGFVVVAQRRLRQLGMFAAIGATVRHLRLAMVANGALIGAVAAAVGAGIGLIGWLLLVPALETAVGHRIERFDVPWWLVVTAVILAVTTATAAAWWPARTIDRVTIVSALSGRPPRPRPVRRSAALAAPLLAVGVACLAFAGDPLDGWGNVALLLVGTVAFVLGVLLVSPLAIRAGARLSRRLSVAERIAIRDLVRYQARSGAALAAITLSIGIAAAVILAASAALYSSSDGGNLSDAQLLVRIGEIPPSGDIRPIPDRSSAEVEQLDDAVDEIADSLDQTTVVPIDVALAPDFEGFGGLPAVVLTEEVEPGLNRILTYLFVANPGILQHYEVDLDTIGPETEVLTVESGELFFEPMSPELVDNPVPLAQGFTSLPGSFITPTALGMRGWDSARAAWLVEAATPITDDQFAESREAAAAAGLTVERRDDQADLAALRTGAAAVGMLLALGILATTVGLIRSESAGDLRILTATGAGSSIRRRLTAATSGGLAAMGALLGVGGAYLAFLTFHLEDLAALSPVPVAHVALLMLGVPALAAGAGWILAGKQPDSITRHPIE